MAKSRGRSSRPTISRELESSLEAIAAIRAAIPELIAEFEEARDAGVSSYRSPNGEAIGKGRSHGDPTLATAGAFEYRHIQYACTRVVGKTRQAERHLVNASRALESARQVLLDAWLDVDPDIGPDRRAKRQAAEAEAVA